VNRQEMYRTIVPARELRIRQHSVGKLTTLAVIAVTFGGLATTGGTAKAAAAATITCPTVSATGVVTPAPAPNVDWVGCDLASANLAGADLAGADLMEADLTGANLSGTDLTGAYLYAVTSGGVTGSPAPTLPVNWTLQGGYLIGPHTYLAGVDLTSLNLAGLDLLGAERTSPARASTAHSLPGRTSLRRTSVPSTELRRPCRRTTSS
jgi:hypothetical protein